MSFSGSYAIAYDAAQTLALALDQVVTTVSLPDDVAVDVHSAVNLIQTVLAPRMTDLSRVAEVGATFADAVMLIGDNATASDTARPMYAGAAAAAAAVPPTVSPALTSQGSLARALSACAEAAFLAQAFLAEARTQFSDRQSAIEARRRIADAMEDATDRIAQAAGKDVIGVLAQVADHCGSHLVTLSTELRPVVRVEAMRSWPSTWLAWSLYGRPALAAELATRNRCGTPLFMPPTIEALSPSTT